ncbi:hydrolase [Mucilaginibacter gynuensis]|uniref:Hydrolase n=1 Tax=Mucilaginibacter gynuensis TaxID=1302236 RepID=A0ABP8HB18_9SPHI
MITAIDKNTALVLIDLQNNIVAYPTVHPIDDIIKRSAELMHAFHTAALPVVIVTVDTYGAPWTHARKEAKQNTAPAPDGALDITPGIKPRETDIFIVKKTWSAFHETGLHEILQERSITNIVLGGVATSLGVEGTARSASALGYNVTFAIDAMTDITIEAHDRSLKYIFPRIGESGTTEKIIEQIPGA